MSKIVRWRHFSEKFHHFQNLTHPMKTLSSPKLVSNKLSGTWHLARSIRLEKLCKVTFSKLKLQERISRKINFYCVKPRSVSSLILEQNANRRKDNYSSRYLLYESYWTVTCNFALATRFCIFECRKSSADVTFLRNFIISKMIRREGTSKSNSTWCGANLLQRRAGPRYAVDTI